MLRFIKIVDWRHSALLRYLALLITVLAALSLTFSARSLFVSTSYALFLAAVMFSSWYGGLTPGLVAVVFSLLALDRYIASPELSRRLSRDDIVHLSVFLFVAGIINHLNRARIRAESRLLKSHQELQTQVHERTADLRHANDTLRRLSGQLMRLQDEERRHMARLLHETVAQTLAALKMDLAVAKRREKSDDVETGDVLDEAAGLADQCIREVRTLSYLLHPPLLDEAGLSSALQWYVSGFQQRSGIAVKLRLPPELGRLPQSLEMTAFRIVQECLTNIHRHSGSADASISVTNAGGALVVAVTDHGRGLAPPPLGGRDSPDLMGVGIMGMRERVKHLGGHMEIQSGPGGTTITATLPFDKISA